MTWYVGADPASIDAGLAAISDTGELRTRAVHLTGDLTERLVQLRLEVRSWLQFAADDGAWCACVERPGTKFGGAALLGSFGVMTEAVTSLLQCPVMTLASAEWKGHALGAGGAKKPALMAFARSLGYEGDSQDVADAVGCAAAARHLATTQLQGAA